MIADFFAWVVAPYVALILAARVIGRLCWRSRKLNRHPGLYLKLWGKWYRVIKV